MGSRMNSRTGTSAAVAALLLAVPSAAHASDEAFELWLNPAVSVDLDDDTAFELETAQRFRNAADGRPDTYYARFWLNQDIGDRLTLSGAVERRINDGSADETRLMQQLSLRQGVLRGRLRLEQRFVDDSGRMGLRVRPRLGVSLPLQVADKLSFDSDAELFLTLRSTGSSGDTGLTGLRTHVRLSYDLSDAVGLSIGYLRQQEIRDGAPDTIGHAPLIALELQL